MDAMRVLSRWGLAQAGLSLEILAWSIPIVSSADGDKIGGQILESDLMVGEDVFLVVFRVQSAL